MLPRLLALLLLVVAMGRTRDATAASVTYPLAWCCSIAVSAPGTLYENGVDIGGGTDGDSIWYSFDDVPSFDLALGTYLGFQIDVSGTLTASASVSADLPPAPGSVVGGEQSVVATGASSWASPGAPFYSGLSLPSVTSATACTGIDFCDASHSESLAFTASTGFLADEPPFTIGYGALATGTGSRPPGTQHRVFLGSVASMVGTGSITFFYTPVPEPGTAVLLGAGVAALSRARSSGTPATARSRPRPRRTRSRGSA